MNYIEELRAAAEELRTQADGGFHPALADLLDAHAEDWDFEEGQCCGPEDECFECLRNNAVLRVARTINVGWTP